MDIYNYWLIFGIILMIAEIFTPGFLLASFSIGAFSASFIAYLGFDYKIQLIIFSFMTMLLFFTIRPLYNKYFISPENNLETGARAFIGNSYVVTESIKMKDNTGRVKIGSESWRARSDSGIDIDKGDSIIVSDIQGSTLIVTLAESKEG